MKKIHILLISFLLIFIAILITTYKSKNNLEENKQTPATAKTKISDAVLNETSEIYKNKPETCLANLGIDNNLTEEILANDFIISLIKNNCLWAITEPIQQKDIDGDGNEEIIFQATPAGSVTGRFIIGYLIVNDAVVFTDKGDSMNMLFTENGFTIKKTHELYDGPGCCPNYFELKKYTYDGKKATLISTEAIDERTITEYLPIKENTYWEYKGTKKEQQENGEIITTSISKKNTVTKIENVAEKTIIYVNGEKNPFLTIQNKIIDFEPDKTDKDKFSLTLPLSKGMRWGSSVNDRNDGYYGWEVEAKKFLNILGKDYEYCYRIAYKTLPDTSYKIFCYGIGIVEEGYVHNGSILEEKYELVDTNIVK